MERMKLETQITGNMGFITPDISYRVWAGTQCLQPEMLKE